MKIILIVSILFISSLSGNNIYSKSDISPPKINNGTLNLSNWDFANDGNVTLDGEWEFYWDTLLGPQDFSSSLAPIYPHFPQLWSDISDEYPSYGYATYRLIIDIQPTTELLAIKLPDFYTSYKLWVNGKEFAHNGIVGTNKENSEPHFLPLTKSFYNEESKLELILQISNFVHSKGGASVAPVLGSSLILEAEREFDLGIDLLLTGAVLIGGVVLFRLILFWQK